MVLAHQRHRLGLQHLVAVAAALVEDHLGELDVVGRRAVEAAAAHVEFRILLQLERDRRQRSVLGPRMHADEALAHRVGDLECGVVHAERRQDIVAQIGIEPRAGHRFDSLADEVDIDAVFPARAGITHHRYSQRGVLAGGDCRGTCLFQILRAVAVPHVVGEARGVRHQMAQRDRLRGGAQFWFAAGVKAFQHLRVGEIGQELADRLVQRKLALLHELHRAGAHDLLGHGGDPEHAVGGHRIVLAEVALAERALVDHLAAGRCHRDHAGNLPGLALLTQNLIDLRFALHGSPPFCFLWKWNDLPPGRVIPQAAAEGRRRCRDLVMGKGGWSGVGRVRGLSGAKLQHLATIRGGRSPRSVTGLTIHDNVISPRFPSPIFCSKAFRFQHKRCSLAGSIDENCLIFRSFPEGAR